MLSHLFTCLIMLRWLSGGATLYIETVLKKSVRKSSKDSEGSEKGEITITGNLGNVIKESVQLAYTYAKNYLAEHDPDNHILETKHIHLHLPEVKWSACCFVGFVFRSV